MNAKTNPLYIVKNDGKNIETASNFLEVIFKKFGLDFLYEYLYRIVEMITKKIKSHVVFTVIIDFIEDYKQLLELIEVRLQKFQL